MVEKSQNNGDITPFIITFTGIIKKAANNTSSIIKTSLKRYQKIYSDIHKLPAWNEKTDYLYMILIAVTLFSENGITKKDLLHELNVSPATLVRRLSQIPKTLLIRKKQGNMSFFSLNYDELMRIINS
jgi:Fic family protein